MEISIADFSLKKSNFRKNCAWVQYKKFKRVSDLYFRKTSAIFPVKLLDHSSRISPARPWFPVLVLFCFVGPDWSSCWVWLKNVRPFILWVFILWPILRHYQPGPQLPCLLTRSIVSADFLWLSHSGKCWCLAPAPEKVGPLKRGLILADFVMHLL